MSEAEETAALLARAREVVGLATAAGARDVFASAGRSRSVEFAARDGRLENVTEATSRSLALEVWVDGRYGASSTTDLRPDRLGAFVTDVVALTRALEADVDRQIADPSLFAGRPETDLQLADPAVTALGRDDHLAVLEALGERVVGKDGVASATCSSSSEHGISAAVSSNGFEGSAESTSFWIGADVTLRDAGDKRPEGSMYAGARHRSDVPDPGSVGREAMAWARGRLSTEKGPTVKTVMVVHPRAASRLIGGLLSTANGAAIQQGRSFWASRLDRAVVSEKLVITDDPLIPRGLGSRWWDGEGIAARVLPIVRGGRLETVYLDTTYARKLGKTPTTGSPSNRVVGQGSRDLTALVGAAGDGILVTSWLGGNMNDTTGDFSYGLRGHRITNGKIGGPVGEMNVTGNIVDLFARLDEVGNDPWRYSATLTPTLVFDGVQFSGV